MLLAITTVALLAWELGFRAWEGGQCLVYCVLDHNSNTDYFQVVFQVVVQNNYIIFFAYLGFPQVTLASLFNFTDSQVQL